MNSAEMRRLVALLGFPLPEDHAEAVKVLKDAIARRKDSRHRAEALAARLAVIRRATERATQDRRLRTSPELDRLRGYGEQLQFRLQKARHASDDVMMRLVAFSDWVNKDGSSSDSDDKGTVGDGGSHETDIMLLSGVRRMKEMSEAHSRQRAATDRIGRTGPDRLKPRPPS